MLPLSHRPPLHLNTCPLKSGHASTTGWISHVLSDFIIFLEGLLHLFFVSLQSKGEVKSDSIPFFFLNIYNFFLEVGWQLVRRGMISTIFYNYGILSGLVTLRQGAFLAWNTKIWDVHFLIKILKKTCVKYFFTLFVTQFGENKFWNHKTFIKSVFI